MPLVILLGNAAPIENLPVDGEPGQYDRQPLDAAQAITTVTPPAITVDELVTAVRDLWSRHSDDVDGPEWVEALEEAGTGTDGLDPDAVERAIARAFTTPDHACSVGRPADWKD